MSPSLPPLALGELLDIELPIVEMPDSTTSTAGPPFDHLIRFLRNVATGKVKGSRSSTARPDQPCLAIFRSSHFAPGPE